MRFTLLHSRPRWLSKPVAMRAMSCMILASAVVMVWIFQGCARAAETPLPGSAQTVDLRGYGKVQAEFAPGQAIFHCADAAHADIVLGKMLADLFWDAGPDATTHPLLVEGVNVTVHAWAPYGVLMVGRNGAEVVAVGAADDGALKIVLLQQPQFLHGTPVFTPEKPYPRFLDHYDLRAYKAYTIAMTSTRGLGLESHWPFLKKYGLGGIAFQSLGVTNQYPAPGVINFVSGDYEMNLAAKENSVAAIGLGGGGEVPLWIYNKMPDAMMQPSPTTLLGGWNGSGYVGAHFESWWLPAERRTSGALLFLRQSMERYRDNPALSAWHLYTGSPGAEFGFHGRTGEFWDYSPVGVAAFRNWLRETRKYDLATLGQRWHGDPKRYTSWEQVEIPDANGFFGGNDPSSVRLAEGWKWASARDGVATPPPADSPDWIPLAMPPSQQGVLLPWGESFYRVEFDAKDFAPRPQVWLACNALARTSNPTVFWLNGVKLAVVPTPESEPVAIALAGKLKPGRNELIVRVPRGGQEKPGEGQVWEGKMFGPMFLTAAEPKRYPYLGTQANARFVDLRMWQIAGVTATHRTMLDMALAIDPDHPFNLSGDASIGNDQFTALAEEYGATCQHTGREAWYHTWWPGLGLVGGFYGTSEESGTPSTNGFAGTMTRELGWMMIDGDSNHNLFHNSEDYQIEEQKTGWFTKHQRAIQCFGKYLRVMPQIAILRSGRNMTLGSQEPWQWDLGTGRLQQAHIDNAYATETELFKGMTDACPVLIDGGTEIMDDDVIAALQRYIEKGGTFIALHQTGRHSSIQQDAQPLARLTGMMTAAHASGKLRIAKEAPVLGAFGDREWVGSGVSLQPTPGAIPGEPPVPVASWDDGSTAIAVRRLGKGRIIQLGTTCWREHFELMERLLLDVGVKRNAQSADPDVWTRKATSKNGLQDWLLAFNNSDTKRTADVRLAVDQKPDVVWDLLTRAPVESTYANGFVTIPKVSFTAHETRLFAVKRADLVEGLAFWWGEKTRFWSRPPAASAPGVAAAKKWLATVKPEANTATIPFQRWQFLADRDGTVNSAQDAWLQVGFADASWTKLDNGPWNLQVPSLADWHGIGLYRSTFTVPPAWKDRHVVLTLFDWNCPIVYDQGEFYLNGTKVADYKARGWSHANVYDVTPLLKEGNNVLAVRVTGGKEFSGICGSIWLAPELHFASELDLAGAWRAVQSDYHTETPAQLPGKPTGRYLTRDFDLPAAWNGKSVFAHVEIENQWLGCIVVNGKLIATNAYLHPFAPRCEVNLTPYLVPGKNRIELWPYATLPSVFALEVKPLLAMPVSVIRLGLVEADREPR